MDFSGRSKIQKVCFLVHLFLFYVSSYGSLKAQPDYPEQLLPYYEKALHYQFDHWPILTVDSLAYSDQPHAIYINALSGSLRQILEGKTLSDEHWNIWTKRLQDTPEEAYSSFYKAELSLLRSILYYINKQELKAFVQFRAAYKQSQQNLQNHPTFLPNLKTSGIINLQIGSLPDKYSWILSLLGFSGSIELGKRQISKLSQSQQVFSTQAQLMDILFNTYIYGEDTSQQIEALKAQSPSSQLLRLISNAIALKNHHSEAILRDTSPTTIPLIYGQIAEAFLNKLEMERAVQYFNKSLTASTKNISAETAYKLYLAHHLKGNTTKASHYQNIVRKEAEVLSEADQHARQQMLSDQNTCQPLLALRLLTDGGYFSQAKEIVRDSIQVKATCDTDVQEFYYRTARLWQLLKEKDLAIAAYRQMFAQKQTNLSYIQPNAHLQLGTLYLSIGDTTQATAELKRVMQYKGYPYEGSIRTKTKLLLKGIE